MSIKIKRKVAKAFKNAARKGNDNTIQRALDLAQLSDKRFNTNILRDLSRKIAAPIETLRHEALSQGSEFQNKLRDAFLLAAREITNDIGDPANDNRHASGRKCRTKFPRYKKRSIMPIRNAA